MWCDRCGEKDMARLGTDEHGVTCGYLVLCDACRTDILDAQENEQALASPPPNLSRRDAGPPLTKSLGIRRGGYARHVEK